MAHPPSTKTLPDESSGPGEASRTPTLSVGLPVYNGAKWIETALDSFLAQEFEDFEVVIADNASTDETEAICRRYAAQDPRIRYFRNPENIGLYRNFDRVFELSSGRYFKWAADSDFCLEGFFEKCVAVLDERPDVVLVCPRTYLLLRDPLGREIAQEYEDFFDIEDDRPSMRFRKYLTYERINNAMHGVIRASALRRTSLIRPMPGSDISMVAELALLGKFAEVPDRLFVRRFDRETSSMLMDPRTAAQRNVPMGKNLGQRIALQGHRFLSVLRAPISHSEKLFSCLYLVRTLVPFCRRVAGRLVRAVVPGR